MHAEFSHEQLLRVAQFSAQDVAEINQRRRANNQLGFAYQLTFVRLANRFPTQQPLEIVDELLSYVSIQLTIPSDAIVEYIQRRQTIAEHRVAILDYLNLRHDVAQLFQQSPFTRVAMSKFCDRIGGRIKPGLSQFPHKIDSARRE